MGDYPGAMREILGSDLPTFTAEEKALLLRYKADFIGLNHYTAIYARDCLRSPCNLGSYEGNAFVSATGERDDGVKIGGDVRTYVIRARRFVARASLIDRSDVDLADCAGRFLRRPRGHRAGYPVREREVQGHACVYY